MTTRGAISKVSGGSLSASQLVAVGRSSSHTLQSPAGLVHWSAAGHRHGARSGHSSGVGGHRVGTVWLAANLWWKSIQSTWGWEGGGGRKAGRICRPTSIGCALSGALKNPTHFELSSRGAKAFCFSPQRPFHGKQFHQIGLLGHRKGLRASGTMFYRQRSSIVARKNKFSRP